MTTPKNQTIEWEDATDPLPDTWDQLMKDFPPVDFSEALFTPRPQPPHPKVDAFTARGGVRLRDALGNTSFEAEGERKAFDAGGQEGVDQDWRALFMSECNLRRPRKMRT